MSRYAICAGALFALAMGGPAQAQQILVPENTAASIAAASTTSGAATTKPARPSGLQSKALSTTEARLTWSDNATNEWEYRLEIAFDGHPFEDLGALPPNATSVLVFGLEPGKTYAFRLRAKNGAGLSPYSNQAAVTAWFLGDQIEGPCQAGDDTLCLGNGRYRVTAFYEAEPGQERVARAVGLTNDSGYFWFFDAVNIEVIVKMVGGCGLNNRNWVFTTGLTNLRVTVLVTDLQTGATATYLNESDRPFAPIQDTDAFATCG